MHIYANFFKELDRLHNQYVLDPADKAGNNIVFILYGTSYCVLKDLSFNSTLNNPTYTHSSLSRQKILQNYQSVLAIFNIPNKQNEFDLPYLYWIPKLHKDPYKHRYIAVSTTCFTKASFFTPYLNFYSCLQLWRRNFKRTVQQYTNKKNPENLELSNTAEDRRSFSNKLNCIYFENSHASFNFFFFFKYCIGDIIDKIVEESVLVFSK